MHVRVMMSNIIDQRYVGLRERCLRGSLPLKKRRVALDHVVDTATTSSTLKEDNKDFFREQSSEKSFNEASVLFTDETYGNASGITDRGMTALSLVATAAVSAYKSSYSFQHNLRQNDILNGNPVNSLTSENLSAATTDIGLKLRPHSPPPDGFCTESPFNEGFGTLHSLRGVGKFENDLYAEDERKSWTSDECVERDERIQVALLKSIGETTTSVDNDKKQNGEVSSISQSHQDKRFTGGEGEVRCLATTTRGRACAYSCVGRTKYCHLHADYDTNPPPRRWSHKGKGDSSSKKRSDPFTDSYRKPTAPYVIGNCEGRTFEDLENLPEPQIVPNSSPPSVVSDEMSRLPSPFPITTSETNSSIKRSRRNSSTKLAAKHADSPFPLLSMISTDQWHQKSVKIASGHLAGQVGRVEKWGNGWVSVDVPGLGLHNRRSFELYLHAGDEAASDAEVQESHTSNEQDNCTSLFRCVSRDVASPLLFSSSKAAQGKDYLSCRNDTRSIPRHFQSCPPDGAERPHAVFARDRNIVRKSTEELSPFAVRNVSVLGQTPKVTPLTSKESRCYDENTFMDDLQIPESISERKR